MDSLMQQIMSEPPTTITTKDLAYLKDALSWELTAFKKCQHFAQECTSPQISQAIDIAGQMHLRHYQRLLNQVDPKSALRNTNQTNQILQ
ncbi:MAG: hypothetical protein JM58_07600 [Peptococcaceae bacterium BICA1-8]|nr:MAG: hypothetical protein JM58_07600 [Peptococcaceae bacterium BICA1-8]